MRTIFCVLALLLSVLSGKAQTYSNTDTLLYKIKQATNKSNQILLILLHGFGANEDDLMNLAKIFPNNVTVVSPRATFPLQPGAYQWYESIKTNGNFGGKFSDIEKSQKLIRGLTINLQRKLHINNMHTVIAGFSQGANMSYQMGLLYPGLCKAIGVFSGVIFDSKKDAINKQHNLSLNIFIGHGTEDNRIPFSEAEKSNQWLESKQFKTEFHSYKGMTHSISDQEMEDFKSFLQKKIVIAGNAIQEIQER